MGEGESFSVKNLVCLVTGGAAGVGAGIVRTLLMENALHVAFLDVSEEKGAALESQLNSKFGALRAKFIKCDVANEDQLAAAYKQILDKYLRLDVVINNAAILGADEDHENQYTRVVNVNFTGTVNSTFKALDIMRVDGGGAGGVVVNISSLLSINLNNELPVYSATKTAILHFSNSIGKKAEYSKAGVRVLTVCLGPTDTAILHRHNIDNDCEKCLTSRAEEMQRVESAATGVVDVVKKGQNGSTWRVAHDKPAEDITLNTEKGFKIMSELIDN